jgi:hypothetical protein
MIFLPKIYITFLKDSYSKIFCSSYNTSLSVATFRRVIDDIEGSYDMKSHSYEHSSNRPFTTSLQPFITVKQNFEFCGFSLCAFQTFKTVYSVFLFRFCACVFDEYEATKLLMSFT